MIVEVEVKREWFNGDIAFLDRLQKRLAHLIRDEVLVRPLIKLVEPGSIPKAEGKAVRVFDRRGQWRLEMLIHYRFVIPPSSEIRPGNWCKARTFNKLERGFHPEGSPLGRAGATNIPVFSLGRF